MGYYIFSFGIKENEILNVFDSKNEEIINKVKQNDYFENYSDQDDEFTTGNALEDVVNGNKFNEKQCHTYGYALISICASLGFELPYGQEIKLGIETDYINQFLATDFKIKDFCIEEFLFSDERLNPFPILDINEFPMLSVVKLEDLKKLKSKLSTIKISDKEINELQESDEEDDEEKGYSYEHIKGFIENINFCIKNELDLFSACH